MPLFNCAERARPPAGRPGGAGGAAGSVKNPRRAPGGAALNSAIIGRYSTRRRCFFPAGAAHLILLALCKTPCC